MDYHRYRFGDTVGKSDGPDPRLAAIDATIPGGLEPFIKDNLCLDIGCNIGTFSRDLVLYFRARRVFGIDIDGRLISRAIRDIPAEHKKSFGYATLDYAANDSTVTPNRYAAVFCMSVSKWIHLHGGDDAVRRALRRMCLEVRADGIVVLEPQVWETYGRKKNMTPETASNYASINFFPEQFVEYMERECEMQLMALISGDENASKGFQRPIYILQRKRHDTDYKVREKSRDK